jgi:hypothetical protein
MFVTSLPRIKGLFSIDHIEKCVTVGEHEASRIDEHNSDAPYSSNVMPPLPTCKICVIQLVFAYYSERGILQACLGHSIFLALPFVLVARQNR